MKVEKWNKKVRMNDKMQREKKEGEEKRSVQIKKTPIPAQNALLLNQHLPWSGALPLSNWRTCLFISVAKVQSLGYNGNGL